MKIFAPAALALSLALAAPALGQDAPTQNIGVSPAVLSEIILSGEFTDIANRVLRMRTITVTPGGIIGLHNHENRPSVEYVLSGTAAEYRGAESRVLQAGDFISADHTTEHYWKNIGGVNLVLLAVDIFQPAP